MTMNAKTYLAGIASLGFTQVAAGELWGVSPRTAQTYATKGPPQAVALALHALLELPNAKRASLVELALGGRLAP